MEQYNPQKIEQKWQKIWEDTNRFSVPNHQKGKQNRYVLIEFPYPSGQGLHTGHVRSYSAMDAVARKLRLCGYNVMFPMGIDAFGLQAERTAIKEKRLPQEIVARNTATFKKQLKSLGLSIDWSREISTCDPDYYKWTQWMFIQFFKHGLAEKTKTMVNYCPNCGVLANEEVEDGKCITCGGQTVQKPKEQWIIKMSKYADRLIDDLDQTHYMQHIKTSQINWIGRSEGVDVSFDTTAGVNLKIYTTCIETIFGIEFMVVAPDSKVIEELKPFAKNKAEIEAYQKQSQKKSSFERKLNKEKSGVKVEGVLAINPVNGKKVPIFVGDFVIGTYANGAVMAVPAHDQRDWEFAQKFGLPITEVISGGDTKTKAYEKGEYLNNPKSRLVASGKFDGLSIKEAKKQITLWLESQSRAEKKVNYSLQDWVFSRQRYWGEPIPMVYCNKCGWQPVPESQLPVTLPKVESYDADKEGNSPLASIKEFVNTTCPVCGGPAKRETDTMPGWAGSSWYFMRYCDPHNQNQFASQDSLKAWLPVGLYNGGNEHTVRHLLFARFWNKFLFDIGYSPVGEPFDRRISQGIVLGSNGVKMSKSLGNVVDPLDLIRQFGADSLRVWEAFMGDYFETVNWSDDGTKSANRLLNRIWNMQQFLVDNDVKELDYAINHAIDKVSNDIDSIKFNTAISEIMTCTNEIYKVAKIGKQQYKNFVTIISPFAPHIAEELFEVCGFGEYKDATWPVCDKTKLVLDQIEIPVQVNGKIRAVVLVSPNSDQQQVLEAAKANADVQKYLVGEIKKVIYVPKKILNIIV